MNNVKKNYIYNLLYQILSVILPLITTPYLSRVLGSEEIGIFSYSLSIVTYFILAGSLGTALYGQREIAYRQNDVNERTTAFWQINIVKWIAASISLFIFYFTCMNDGNYGMYFSIFVLQMVADAIDISWYYKGLENFKITVTRNITVKIISLFAIFIFVKSSDDLWIYILIYCLSNLVSNVYLWIKLPKYIGKKKISFVGMKKHFLPILSMFLPQVTIQIYTVLDRTMLGVLTKDMHEVGIYEQALKINRVAQTLVTAMGTVMLPRISSLISSGDNEAVKKSIKKSLRFAWFSAMPIMMGIIAIADNLVPWFLGDDFYGAIPVLRIGALLVLVIGLSNVTGLQYLVPKKRQSAFTASLFTGAIINFFGNLLLIPIMGAQGAILFSVIAELSILFVQIFMIRDEFTFRDIFHKSWKSIISSIVMAAVIYAVSLSMAPNMLSSVILIVIGIIIYAVLQLLLKEEFATEIYNSLKRMLRTLFAHML